MAYLILVRHGQSEWNALGKWTGSADVSLTDRGKDEARQAAKTLEGITFGTVHVSDQKRAKQTLDVILEELGQAAADTKTTPALNERDYGELTGKNKWQVKEEYGTEQWMKWRRGWDDPVPGGETLKDVYDRAAPYYEKHILTDLKSGQNVLVSASGNSLRAVVKHLENIAESDIPGLEIGTGEVYCYEIEPETGRILAKDIKITGGKA